MSKSKPIRLNLTTIIFLSVLIFLSLFYILIQKGNKRLEQTKLTYKSQASEGSSCATSCPPGIPPRGGCKCNVIAPWCAAGFRCDQTTNPPVCQPFGSPACLVVNSDANTKQVVINTDEDIVCNNNEQNCLPRYFYIAKKIIDNPPFIGGGDDEYLIGIESGIGFSTYYGPDELLGFSNTALRGFIMRDYMNRGKIQITNDIILLTKDRSLTRDDLPKHLQYLYDITENCPKPGEVIINDLKKDMYKIFTKSCFNGIANYYSTDMSSISPLKGLASNKVSGYISTRSPMDIGKKFLVFIIKDPNNQFNSLEYQGIVLSIDTAALIDWNGANTASQREGDGLGQLTYSYQGWKNINWLADVSKNIFNRLPIGLSGDRNNIGEGRPGLLLIEEEEYNRLLSI